MAKIKQGKSFKVNRDMQLSQYLKYSPISWILVQEKGERLKIGLLNIFGSCMPKFDVGINGLVEQIFAEICAHLNMIKI